MLTQLFHFFLITQKKDRMVLLQLISISVNALCLIQKIPQIYQIFKTKDVESISVSSVILEETA